MAIFHFPYEALLKKRIQEEQQVQMEMATVKSKWNAINENIHNLSDTQNQYSQKKSLFFTGAALLQQFSTAQQVFSSQLESLRQEREKVRPEMESWQKKLAEYSSRRQALEIMRERAFREFRKEEEKVKRLALEEVSASRKAMEMIREQEQRDSSGEEGGANRRTYRSSQRTARSYFFKG